MRIAYLSTFFPLRGGIAHFNERFALELQRRGHAVRAITFSRQYPKVLFPGKTQEETGGAAGEQAVTAEVRVDSIGPLSWWRTGRSIRKQAPDVLVLKYWISFFPGLAKAFQREPSRRRCNRASIFGVVPRRPMR